MGRDEEKRGWEVSGPPPGPTPAAPAWLSDTEEGEVKRGNTGKKGEKREKEKISR